MFLVSNLLNRFLQFLVYYWTTSTAHPPRDGCCILIWNTVLSPYSLGVKYYIYIYIHTHQRVSLWYTMKLLYTIIACSTDFHCISFLWNFLESHDEMVSLPTHRILRSFSGVDLLIIHPVAYLSIYWQKQLYKF